MAIVEVGKRGGALWILVSLIAVLDPSGSSATAAPDRDAGMAPVGQYLMDRQEEIALARSAAPDAVSHDAAVYVLGRSGYEKAAEGTNGFVCIVERAWVGTIDAPEFWNPKIRGADCYNPPAARSILPLVFRRATLVMAGRSKEDLVAALRAGLAAHDFGVPEPGAIGYMMAKGSYLTDAGSHNGPHIMFFMPIAAAADWGADVKDSPLQSISFWVWNADAYPQLKSLPPLRVFTVGVRTWSDGSPAAAHHPDADKK